MKAEEVGIDIREFCEVDLGLKILKETASGQLNLYCPVCSDGKPDHFYLNAETGLWKCHKCETGGNLRTLVGILHECGEIDDEGREKALKKIAEDEKDATAAREDRHRVILSSSSRTAISITADKKVLPPHISNIWKATVEHCHASMAGDDLLDLQKRIAIDTISHFKVGVVPSSLAHHLIEDCGFSKDQCVQAGVLDERDGKTRASWRGAFLIPYWLKDEVVALEYRLRDAESVDKYGKYRAPSGYQRQLFNTNTLLTSSTVCLAEGAFDAMTLAENGYSAVGIPGNGAFKPDWAQILREAGIRTAFIILDNDEKGSDKGRARISKIMTEHLIEAIQVSLPCTSKDVNDFFRKDGGTKRDLDVILDAALTEYRKRVYPTSLTDYWPTFEENLRSRIGRKLLGSQSGFTGLDLALNGIRGVTVLAAMPGTGKTTLALQLAWQIADLNKVPILYVSFEMFRQELMEKVVSRLTETPYKVIAMGEIFGAKGEHHLHLAKTEIERTGKLISIVDRSDRARLSIDQIALQVELIKRLYETERAFVVVDSLQNLCTYIGASTQRRGTTKEIIDETMMALYDSAYAHRFDALLISHIPKSEKRNIDNPEQFIFSGSGGIDFESDVTTFLSAASDSHLGGKKRKAADDDGDDDDGEAAAGSPRSRIIFVGGSKQLDLTILKNRFGPTKQLRFQFHGEISKFEELI